jgi:hypothetical protein
VGKLKYTNVTAGSYLEMWSYFAPEQPGGPEGAYFSRTLADAGPMAKLEGTDDGRDFSLPFDATGAKTKLIRLVLNIHFGGPGWIELRQAKLVQYPDAAISPTPQGAVPAANAVAASRSEGLTTDYERENSTLLLLRAELQAAAAVPHHDSDLQALRDQIIRQQMLVDRLRFDISKQALHNLDWKSFFLGVLATCALLFIVMGLRVILRHVSQFRHARELRRIASLDT